MLSMCSQQLIKRILSTDAFASPLRLPYKFEKAGGNDSEGHIAAYSEDDTKKVLPATSTSIASSSISENSVMVVIAAVHQTGVIGV